MDHSIYWCTAENISSGVLGYYLILQGLVDKHTVFKSIRAGLGSHCTLLRIGVMQSHIGDIMIFACLWYIYNHI